MVANISGTYDLQYQVDWSQVQLNEIYIVCDTSLIPCTVILPRITAMQGFYNLKVYVSDSSGNAAINNITIKSWAGNTINALSQLVINTNLGSCACLVVNSMQWLGAKSFTDGNVASGILSLNGLIQANQLLTTGEAGTDFNVSSTVGTHVFNLPTASATSRGALSPLDWANFNSKEASFGAGTTLDYLRGDKTFQVLNTAVVPESGNEYFTNSRARAAISASSPLSYDSSTGVMSLTGAIGGVFSGTATGTDTYSVTISGVDSYIAGNAFVIKFINGNTGGSTLQINALSAITIKKTVSTDIASGDILSGQEIILIYDGTYFQAIGLVGSTGGVSSVTGTSPIAVTPGSTPVVSLNTAYGDTLNPFGVKPSNTILAGPSTGADALPLFRALVVADIPAMTATVGGAVPTPPNDTTKFLNGAGAWANIPTPSALTFMFANIVSDIATYYQAVALSNYSVGSLGTITTAGVSTSPTLLGTFATNAGYPNATILPIGTITCHYETKKASGSNNYYTFFRLYKRNLAGTETLLLTSDDTSQSAVNTTIQNITSALNLTLISLLATDRLVIKIYGVMLSSTASIDLYFDATTNSRIELPYVVNTLYQPLNSNLTDISSIASPSLNDVIKYNGTNWVASTVSGSTVGTGGTIFPLGTNDLSGNPQYQAINGTIGMAYNPIDTINYALIYAGDYSGTGNGDTTNLISNSSFINGNDWDTTIAWFNTNIGGSTQGYYFRYVGPSQTFSDGTNPSYTISNEDYIYLYWDGATLNDYLSAKINNQTRVTALYDSVNALGNKTGFGDVSFKTINGSSIFGTGNLTITGSGTVTNVSSADANATVSNPTTTPEITIVSAPKWATARTLAGNSVDGSANVQFANKFIVQGTADAGLSGAQFLGALATGIVKNTTTTGVLSIAINSDLPAMSSTVGGAVPTPPNDTTKFLRGDATWAVPSGGSDLPLTDISTSISIGTSHVGKFLKCIATSAITITLDSNSTAIAIDTEIPIVWFSGASGQPTITLVSPVTSIVNSGGASFRKIAAIGGVVILKKVSNTEWLLYGQLGV
jgi:hypothetical protein